MPAKFVTDRGDHMRKELMIGCGSRLTKDLRFPTWKELDRSNLKSLVNPPRIGIEFEGLVTLDINYRHAPHWLCDLSIMHDVGTGLKFKIDYVYDDDSHSLITSIGDNSFIGNNVFDEIHAYEVLEHIGAQGDYKLFFAQFTEFHRILKPNGLLFATVPMWCSPWAWGDPSHTRVITSGTLAFLSQKQYIDQVGKTPMSDFRPIYTADFDTLCAQETADTFLFVLRAIK